MEIFSARLTERVVFNPNYFKLHLELKHPNRIEFRAGQYVLMTVPGHDQRKSYSITSIPEMNHAVELVLDTIPGGVGSEYLMKLEIGNDVEFRGPVGSFVVSEEDEHRPVVFVATGSGIAPIRSMLLDRLISRQNKEDTRLYWGLRYVEDMFWEEDLYQLDKEFENFKFEIILSKPPESGWELSRGYVTDLLAKRIDDFGQSSYYLCGSKAMVEDCSRLLVGKNVQPDRVHGEKFY